MASPVLGYLNYRIVDSNAGGEVVGDLPHLHRSQWKVRGLQPGVTGSASLGEFTLPLHPPSSNEGRSASAMYDALDKGQRVEAYWASPGATTPYQSGVITSIERPADGPWVVHGSDTLWWLQQSQLFPGETIGPGAAPAKLIQLFSATREVVYDAWLHIGSQNVVSGSISNVTADPQFGLQGISSTGFAVMLAPTSWSAGAQYNWPSHPSDAYASQLSIWGTIAADTNVTNSGGCGILWLSDATAQNGFLAEFVTTFVSGTYSVAVKVWTESGGSFTLQGAAGNVFTGLLSSTFPFHFSVTLFQSGSNYMVKCFLNGKDSGLAIPLASLGGITSGRIGIRPTSSGASTQYVNRIRFESRTGQYGTPGTWGTNRFQVGTTTGTTAVIPQITSQNQTHLDIIQLAMSLDGFVALKTTGRGYKGDTLTYGNLGTDRTAQIVLREGENIVAQGTMVGPVADMYSTVTRYSAVPGDSSGGVIEWPGGPIASVGDLVLTDTVTDVAAPGASLQLANAIQIGARKASPLTAYQIGVVRTPDVAEQFGLYDRLLVDHPSLRINRQSLQVIGWDFTEGRATMPVYFNQFPMRALPQQGLQRIQRVTEWLAQHAT